MLQSGGPASSSEDPGIDKSVFAGVFGDKAAHSSRRGEKRRGEWVVRKNAYSETDKGNRRHSGRGSQETWKREIRPRALRLPIDTNERVIGTELGGVNVSSAFFLEKMWRKLWTQKHLRTSK